MGDPWRWGYRQKIPCPLGRFNPLGAIPEDMINPKNSQVRCPQDTYMGSAKSFSFAIDKTSSKVGTLTIRKKLYRAPTSKPSNNPGSGGSCSQFIVTEAKNLPRGHHSKPSSCISKLD